MKNRSPSTPARRPKNQLDLFAPPARPLTALPKAVAPPRLELPQVALRPQEKPLIPDAPPKNLPRHEPASGAQRGLLDVREAAAYVGLSKSTLDKMRCFGTGPRYIKLTSAAVRYDPADLKEWIATRRSPSA